MYKRLILLSAWVAMSMALMAGANDLLWDYTEAPPQTNPDRGLRFGGVVNDAFGDGEDKITLMVLADSGELLILSGYNLARDHHALYLFLTELLENVSMDGAAVYVAEDAAATASPEV